MAQTICSCSSCTVVLASQSFPVLHGTLSCLISESSKALIFTFFVALVFNVYVDTGLFRFVCADGAEHKLPELKCKTSDILQCH